MFRLPKRLLLTIFLLLLGTVTNSAQATTAIEFYKADIDHYFMTADSIEATSLDNNTSWNWVRTGKTFNVWPQASAPSNASPVCRFYGLFANGTMGSHFYTIDQDECAYVKSRIDWGWSYEGNAFYAVKPTGGSCPSGTSPVYRAYNNGMGGAPNHRYMASQTDLNTMVSQGWSNEGIVMCSGSSEPTGYTNSAKLVGGTWAFIQTVGSSVFTDTYSFASVSSSPTSTGTYVAYGTDKYGDAVSGGYSPSGDFWAVLDEGVLFDNFYTFNFTDNNHISGCYYFIMPPGASDLGKCYPLIGSRSPLQPLGKSFASSSVLQSHKLNYEALLREVANDTEPGFVEQGAVEAYLLHRKKVQ